MTHGTLIDGAYTKKESENQKLRMGGGSWSINLDELPKEATMVVYETPQRTYSIMMGKAYEKGFIRMLGGERKLIVPLKYWDEEDGLLKYA